MFIHYIMLAASLGCAVGRNVFSKLGGDRFSGLSNVIGTNIFTAVLAIVAFGITRPDFSLITPEIILYALVYSILSMLSPCLHIIAMEKGSVSVCSLIYGCAFLPPTIFGIFFRNDIPSVFSVIGILLVIFAIFLTTGKPGKGGGFVFISLGAMLASGGVGIVQTLFSNTHEQSLQNELLFTAFTFNLIISAVLLLVLRIGNKQENMKLDSRYFIAATLLAACVVGQNTINLELSGKLPSVLMFPVISGGGIAVTTILSRLIFREKLKARQMVGICVAIAAIVLIFI